MNVFGFEEKQHLNRFCFRIYENMCVLLNLLLADRSQYTSIELKHKHTQFAVWKLTTPQQRTILANKIETKHSFSGKCHLFVTSLTGRTRNQAMNYDIVYRQTTAKLKLMINVIEFVIDENPLDFVLLADPSKTSFALCEHLWAYSMVINRPNHNHALCNFQLCI